MGAALKLVEPAFPSALPEIAEKTVLRFLTCGSVDDGKSTLIGRLLHDTGSVPEDQLEALAKDSKRFGTQGARVDYALLVDGLAAEREQGITIDVAYRYFATPNRSFIVADTPGHEQYTRNMATGASTADLAIILVDATKGILPQTRRHSAIVALLGVKHVVLAINKMDAVAYSEGVYDRLVVEYASVAAALKLRHVTPIPLSALEGDNIVTRSKAMDWYRGSTLLAHLETVEIGSGPSRPFRFPVQWVNRPSSDFRGFSGRITSGQVKPGDAVKVLPSGRTSRIARIVTFDGDSESATEGESVTLTLADEVDVSRGDVLVAAADIARAHARLSAKLLWMAETPLVAGGDYLIKLGTRESVARVTHLHHAIDIPSLEPQPTAELAMNGLGAVSLSLETPMVALDYEADRDLGAFILIDRLTLQTVALGLVTMGFAPSERNKSTPIRTFLHAALADDRIAHRRSLAKAVSWRVIGSIVTFGIAFALTSSFAIAGAIALIEIALKTLLYYAHERAWLTSRFGLARMPAAQAASDGAGI